MTTTFDRPLLSDLAPTAKITAFKKADPPQLGEAFGERYNDYYNYGRLPGGGIVQFNLDKLTIEDFRQMKDHYQINASLSVLTFMMHQLDWKIVCENKKIADFCQANMNAMWTRLVRALSQAFWCGYSPCILQWENVLGSGIQLTKIKDLTPERADIWWEEVDGWAPPGRIPPKLRVYGGIKIAGQDWPVPPENTLWYTLLKENQNWYGKKLLRPAFTSWYFSILVHLFANHYMERFGEPIPVGRAPYDTVVNPDKTKTTGQQRMIDILNNLRNRAVVVLPNDRTHSGTDSQWDYEIEYLESQMRGADFERYLMRLDEEISLSLFTPLLILRTADVGSYNLGTGHWNVYQQMLNAMSGDWAEYIDRYVLAPMVKFNFGPNAKLAHIKFRKLGDEKMQLVITLLQALIAAGKAQPNIEQLGEIAGLTVEEVQEVTSENPETDPSTGDSTGGNPDDSGSGRQNSSTQAGRRAAEEILYKMAARAQTQYSNARREGKNEFAPDFGHHRQLEVALNGSLNGGFGRRLAVAESWVSDMYSVSSDLDVPELKAVLVEAFLGDA